MSDMAISESIKEVTGFQSYGTFRKTVAAIGKHQEVKLGQRSPALDEAAVLKCCLERVVTFFYVKRSTSEMLEIAW